MSKQKGTRVWVAVLGREYLGIGKTRRFVVDDLHNMGWRRTGAWKDITIRRATLIVDPVKPHKRKGAA